MTPFNEDSRVKIPALLHLTRLGYTYISLKHSHWDARNNIFPDLFEEAGDGGRQFAQRGRRLC